VSLSDEVNWKKYSGDYKMRKQVKPYPEEGNLRYITRFLWLPKTINCQMRWLERATYEQVYRVHTGRDGSYFWWEDRSWFDDKITDLESSEAERSKEALKTAVIMELEEQALLFQEIATLKNEQGLSLIGRVVNECADRLLKHAKAIKTDECKLAVLCEPKYPTEDESGKEHPYSNWLE
jgi:hypothetical protein